MEKLMGASGENPKYQPLPERVINPL